MEFNIQHRPSYAVAEVKLNQGESIVSEGGAMVTMSGDISIETSTMSRGGGGAALLKGLKRLLTGESFFLNKFTSSSSEGGSVSLAPTLVGDVEQISLSSTPVLVQSSSFLAASPNVDMDTQFSGMKGLFSGEGLFWIKMTGPGDLLVSSFGAIFHKDIDGTFICDTGHIAAFEESLTFKVKKVGGWKATILSGEGLVTEFTGKGRLWMQTHNAPDFGRLVGRMLPPRKE
jgi:uncharacterized protein (TIGR00266 family)